ncbi:GNAT family N-acetyltransferase [Jeotgalibacillus aurantiacus]|uniref:GNAT family N-acetyltransferase n=1 Tax=Jeotgalibacillus aurantiacus TaxID=2763266 RepID=UPI001D0B074E|nr:GNAT family protein [Jeotgalibacillus aurantiacus]
MLIDNELVLRRVEEHDLPVIWEGAFSSDTPEWKRWDAPYFPHHRKTYEEFLKKKEQYVNAPDVMVIEINGDVYGTVTYYWEHEPSKWLEMGITFYREVHWGKGYGTRALRLWIGHLFDTLPLVRVGYTTWSGNHRMIRVGEKLGMQMEARIRKVRFHDGQYFDSIRMGMLREEWIR